MGAAGSWVESSAGRAGSRIHGRRVRCGLIDAGAPTGTRRMDVG